MHTVISTRTSLPSREISVGWALATAGVKPAFTANMARPLPGIGRVSRWFKGEREFGTCKSPREFCLAEWNAQFFGDHAYAD